MIGILGKRNFIIIVFLGVLVSASEVILTLTMSNLISVLFSSSSGLFYFIDVKWIGLLIVLYLVIFVFNYTFLNYISFTRVITYSNQKVLDLILHKTTIKLKREEFVNVYVGEMFRVVDKIVINFSNVFSKLTATIFLLILGIYLAGFQFAVTLGGFLLFFILLAALTHGLSKKVSSNISQSNEDRINLLTSLYENRLIFMLTRSSYAINKLLLENKYALVRVRVLANLLTGLPRILVDTVLFTSVLVLYFLVQRTYVDSSSIIFTAVLTLRLLPILNQLYHGFSEYRNNSSSLQDLVKNYCDTNDYSWGRLQEDNKIVEWRDVEVVYENKTVSLPDFTLNRGDQLLLRGPSGSGKSTFLKLLLNQVKCAHGALARHESNLEISLCEQSALLFPGNILFNITFNNSLASVDVQRLTHVCEVVRIFDFIDGLEGLKDSHIDSMGSNFSGGQKQRIALARALYKKAELYIFDEATSALNTELQGEIYQKILCFLGKSTSIHVSHQEQIFKFFSKQIYLNDKF